MYDANGRELQSMDYSTDESVRDFASCTFNPGGDTVVFGAFNRLYAFAWSSTKNVWEEVAMKHVRALSEIVH
jgi:intraflagellar transport protein 172